MSRFYYVYHPINQSNAFTKSQMLKWVLAALENKHLSVNKAQGIDILLNNLPVADVISLYNEIVVSEKINNNYNKPRPIKTKNSISEKAYVILVEFLEEFWNENTKIEKKIKKTFKLSDDELTALFFCCLVNLESDFENLVTERNHRKKNQIKFTDNFSKITKLPQSKSIRIFSKSSPLFKFEFIDEDFEPNTQLFDYLTGFSDSPFLSSLYKKCSEKPLPLKAHSIRKNDNEIIKNIVLNNDDKGINILLYGIPGTGKTEYARSLAANLKLNLYEIISHNNNVKQRNSYNKPINRFTSFYACQNTIPQDKSIILIDEADEMLNGKSAIGIFSFFGGNVRNTEKNKINELIDNSNSVSIWVTNHFKNIDDSTRRRFDYSIEFKKFEYKQRLNVWKTAIKKHDLCNCFSKEFTEKIARKFEINAGTIDIVLRNFKRIPVNKRTKDTLNSLIKPHQKLMSTNNFKSDLTHVKNYSLKGLNIKGEHSLKDGLEIISEFSSFMKTDGFSNSEINNMNLLLYGPPGTGKTEFVKYMSKKIGRKLILKRGSDFLNKYVGETEQNIKRAFGEAETENAVLFIDEADGLFFDRNNSQRSFETTQVNELLIQMENFKGIFVCSSNFQKNMDAATFRRFNLKFEFDYLTEKGKLNFYKIFLAKYVEKNLTKTDKEVFMGIKGLTPGDFKVVQQKYAFFKKKKLNHQFLIKALGEETSYKQITEDSKIGFQV